LLVAGAGLYFRHRKPIRDAPEMNPINSHTQGETGFFALAREARLL
jgi:hypothetical protein